MAATLAQRPPSPRTLTPPYPQSRGAAEVARVRSAARSTQPPLWRPRASRHPPQGARARAGVHALRQPPLLGAVRSRRGAAFPVRLLPFIRPRAAPASLEVSGEAAEGLWGRERRPLNPGHRPPSAGGQVWTWVRAEPWRPRERSQGAGKDECRHPLGAPRVKNGAGCRVARLLPFDGRAFLQLTRYSRTCRAFFLFLSFFSPSLLFFFFFFLFIPTDGGSVEL